MLNKNHCGGPLYYLGNRFLTLPNLDGLMKPDFQWLEDTLALIQCNHAGQYERLIEPFAGSASLSIAAMELGLAKQYIINDTDEVLITFHKLVRDDPKQIITTYQQLEEQFADSLNKKEAYLEIINKYNNANQLQKACILPFIVNYSWSGFLVHNKKRNILYRPLNEVGILTKPSLSLVEFKKEIERVSQLFNSNQVTFLSGDFIEVTKDCTSKDLVILNPPYPENSRDENTCMYVEIYQPEALHRKIHSFIDSLEQQKIDFIMTYGFYNPALSQYVIHDNNGVPKNYFNLLGYPDCAFGQALDQLYFSSHFKLPSHLQKKYLRYVELFEENRKPSQQEALHIYLNKVKCNKA